MKTIYFKSGLFVSAVALLCSVIGISCTANDIELGQEIDSGFDAIYETNLSLQDANTGKSENLVGLYDDTYQTELRLNITKVPSQTFRATATYDATYLDKYNAANGTDYELYPEKLVTFEKKGKFSIGKNANSATLTMTVIGDDDVLVAGKTYMIPVCVTTTDMSVSAKENAGHCVYLISDQRNAPNPDKGRGPKGILVLEVNDVNPLNALVCQLDNGKLIWDVVVLFAANINMINTRPSIKCNENVKYLLDNNETFIQPLRKRGIKVLLGIVGNHEPVGFAMLTRQGAKDFAAEVAHYCEAYNLDGVYYDDEHYSNAQPDLNNPALDNLNVNSAAYLCYETRKAMPDKLISYFLWGGFNNMPSSVDGLDANEWVDIITANYGSIGKPFGNITKKKCTGASRDFYSPGRRPGLGSSGDYIDEYTKDMFLSQGYGWFMGYDLNPEKYSGINSQLSGYTAFEEIFEAAVKKVDYYYKKDDPKPYPVQQY